MFKMKKVAFFLLQPPLPTRKKAQLFSAERMRECGAVVMPPGFSKKGKKPL